MALGEGTYIGIMVKIPIFFEKVVSNHGEYPILRIDQGLRV
jgi:hypothetical protein